MTSDTPEGVSCNWVDAKLRNRRLTRLRVTALPICFETTKPTSGCPRSASGSCRLAWTTTLGRPARTPFRIVQANCRDDRIRNGAGSITQADSSARPLRRRAARMARPARLLIRARKPWVRERRRLLGWNVRLLKGSLRRSCRACFGRSRILGRPRACADNGSPILRHLREDRQKLPMHWPGSQVQSTRRIQLRIMDNRLACRPVSDYRPTSEPSFPQILPTQPFVSRGLWTTLWKCVWLSGQPTCGSTEATTATGAARRKVSWCRARSCG